ncbi:ABC transporter ATP-binding protein [Microbacterium pumilum]|uniref:ABC transporter domain-containing protein n=1 Tax=Microbacterium pumilum TaxID=344165 RepID=A0ABN2RV97_9MICO
MPEGLALEFSGVTKRFGAITAVSDFSARVEPGHVTGFLGPNGAGKTTSLRILLGLVRATQGTATIAGVPYAKLDRPLQTVGAVLEASSFHPGRTAASHLAVYADAAGIPRSRVDDVLGLVGLADSAGRKVGGFSLGMRQRLGLAYALLGDPGILVLDEPANGLDPEGIKWMRGFLRQLAREGRTVLTSSHLLAEVQQTVDALLVISQGRLVFQGALDELTDPSEYATVVDSPDRPALVAALRDAGVTFEVLRSGLTARGFDTAQIGQIAASAGIALSSLQRRGPALEEVFLELVDGTRVHSSAAGEAPGGAMSGAGVLTAGVAAEIAEPNPDPEPEPQPDHQPDPQPDPVAAVDAPTPPAGFVVASTGVIDIITPDEGEPDAVDVDEPEPANQPPTFTVDGQGVTVEGETAGTAEAPAHIPDSDRPWEAYVKTESDLEADAFFSSFDAQRAAAAAEAARLVEAEPQEEPEPEPEPEFPPDDRSEAATDEPPAETSEFGGLADLSPDWVEEDRPDRDGGEGR